MINGLNNENYMDSIGVKEVFVKEDEEKSDIKTADFSHLEEDVKEEEKVIDHLLHKKKE